MIKWDLTKQEFGTDESNTRKLDWVIVECDKCHVQARRKYAQHKQTMKKKGRYYCSNCATKSTEFKSQCSHRAKEKWKDEGYKNNVLFSTSTKEYRQKLSKSSKKQWDDMEFREKISNESQKRWENEEYRDMVIAKLKESWTREKKVLTSERMKKQWNNEEYRKTMKEVCSKNSKKMWKEKRDDLMKI